MGGGGEKAKNFKGTMGKLIKHLSKYKLQLIIVCVFAAASSIFSILGPDYIGKIITKIFEGIMAKISDPSAGIDFAAILEIIIFLICFYILSAAFSYIQGFTMTGISNKVTYNFRREISQKINRMPLGFFDTHTHGDTLSRITNDVDTISQSLSQSLTQIITSLATVIGVLVMMIRISGLMTLVTVIIIPVSLVFVMLIVKKSQKYFREQQEYIGHLNGHVEEMYGGHVVVKAFNGEESSIEKFEQINRTLYTSNWKSQFYSGVMMPIMTFVGNIGYVAVCILGGWLAAKKTIEVGDISAFIQYVRNFTQPLSQLANISSVLQQTAAAAERVFEFLGEDEEVSDNSAPVNLANAEITGKVEFRNVHFGYNPEKTIINDFSATANPGQRIAIVGPTGAGKTTMVKLLMRFYDVNEGAIFIDDHEIRDFTRSDLRSLFGMVLQDTWLFNGSVMENIRYGKLDATDEEVIEASRAAHVHRFIQTLPDSYKMELNEDASNVSQGQKQLLTIARAFLANPKILILDEATSSVDTRTEIQIQRAMEKLMRGRTSFVIAHRLSTIRNADLILCMRDGDIVEQGTHDELLALDGFYAEVYNSQFGG